MKTASRPTQKTIAIARRATAIKRHWTVRERNDRANLAKQLQSLLFASMALSTRKPRAVA